MELEQIQNRIADLESLCKNILDKLQAVIDHSNNLEKLALTKSEFHDKKMSLESCVKQNNASLEKNVSDLQEKFDYIKGEMASFNIYFDTHKKRISNQEDKIQAINHELAYQKQNQIAHQMKINSLDQLNSKTDVILSEHQYFKKDILRYLDNIKVESEKHDFRLKPLENLIMSHDNKISVLDKHALFLSNMKQSLDSLQQDHKNLEASSARSLSDMFIQLQSRIDKIPIVELPKPVDVNGIVQATHKDLSDRLHAIALDIENNNLKSNNNDMQIKQFEKKLENIYLLLKKHEITK